MRITITRECHFLLVALEVEKLDGFFGYHAFIATMNSDIRTTVE